MTDSTVDARVQHALETHFGFATLRTGQAEVIHHLLAGRSAAAVFPTGGGKSLCYQLPALLFDGVTLVVSPLIALMKDQIDALARRGIRAARLDSSLDADAYREVMGALRSGELKLLYVAPERFNNERFRENLKPLRIALFAVDEAHCISEWGHNFRPDYLKLAGFARDARAERLLALTATATPAVLDDIRRGFEIAPECAIRTGFHRANLHIETQVVGARQRDHALREALTDAPPGPAIVYVTLQKTAERVAAQLAEVGFNARAYHAGMTPEQRNTIQEWFMGGDRPGTKPPVVVATIAFGMGVDKADIRAVHHYNLPKSLENYSQEIGRAGRDGLPALCRMLVCADDLNVLENFIYGDTPDEASLRDLIATLFGADDEFDLALSTLSTDTDIRPLVLRTLLTYLELDGHLQAGTPFYADYRFQPLLPSAEILARFDGERRAFLAGVFRHAVKQRTWFSLDLDATARAMQVPRERVVTALDWLGEQQMLAVKAAGLRHRYRVLRRPEDPTKLAASLFTRMTRREQAEIERLQQVLDLVTLEGCQSNALAAHFGELREEPCGHCGACRHGPQTLPGRVQTAIEPVLAAQITALREEHAVLASPRRLARFLCGISSPQLGRHKLAGHALFGHLENHPYGEVLAWLEAR